MAKMLRNLLSDTRWKLASQLPALESDESPATLPLPALKALLSKGLARGIVAETSGSRSSGKTALCLQILAQATRRGEVCAVVDLHNNFHPESASDCGVVLDRLLWVRCNSDASHTIRVADLLLHAGGFGIVLIDLGEAHPKILNKIPISYWYRFRRAVENTPTIVLFCTDTPQLKSAGNCSLVCQAKAHLWAGKSPFALLKGLETTVSQSKAISLRPAALRFLNVA